MYVSFNKCLHVYHWKHSFKVTQISGQVFETPLIQYNRLPQGQLEVATSHADLTSILAVLHFILQPHAVPSVPAVYSRQFTFPFIPKTIKKKKKKKQQ